MAKQVRIRRGTTVQHELFTGAEGEVTMDTTKKILVLHDGVTPGGRPIEGWVNLDPGNPLVEQEVKSVLLISGGDADTPGLLVERPAVLTELSVYGRADVKQLAVLQEELAYGATVNLDFKSFGGKRLGLAGNVTFTTSNLGFGLQLLVRITADGSSRTLAFPAEWKFAGSTAPASIAANKTALLRLHAFGTTEADVVAQYLVEP